MPETLQLQHHYITAPIYNQSIEHTTKQLRPLDLNLIRRPFATIISDRQYNFQAISNASLSTFYQNAKFYSYTSNLPPYCIRE